MTVKRDPNWLHQQVRITRTGQMFIGDTEFPCPILADSVKIEPQTSRHRDDGDEAIVGSISRLRANIVTLSFLVGDVSIETKVHAVSTGE